jgi:hypothetical protein
MYGYSWKYYALSSKDCHITFIDESRSYEKYILNIQLR